MLYGISLIAGLVNAVHLPTVALRLSTALPNMGAEELTVLGLACLLVAVGWPSNCRRFRSTSGAPTCLRELRPRLAGS